MTQLQMTKSFLTNNGWKNIADIDDEYLSFHKDGNIGVNINFNEIVLISDEGDFCHLPLNIFALIGALLHYRAITFNYKNW